jgi:hypothetical protein
MTIDDYVNSKTVKYEELQNNFTLERRFQKRFSIHSDEKNENCVNCGSYYMNTKWLRSEPWTSCQFCNSCKSINLIIASDPMGGNTDDTVEVYKTK